VHFVVNTTVTADLTTISSLILDAFSKRFGLSFEHPSKVGIAGQTVSL
jgi:hypothetical protein